MLIKIPNKKTPWSPIGYLVTKRTYSRRLDDKDPNSPTEEWDDIINRCITATDTQLNVGFTDEEKERLFDHMHQLRGTVAGRFLWQLGTTTVDKLGLPSLQNCACCVVDEPIRPFTWAMDMLMLGCGVGFNIQREYVYKLPKVLAEFTAPERLDTSSAEFIVPDTREGWVKLLEYTLRAAFDPAAKRTFTYSTQLIRGSGAAIKGFGGTASGPEILCEGIGNIAGVLDSRRGKQLRPIDCLDIMNIIGSIVIAGNVRRSAQIAIGDYDDFLYLRSKRWDLGNIPNWRSNSNNSVLCNDFSLLPEEIWKGYDGTIDEKHAVEPFGLINLKLSRQVGRTGDKRYPDKEVIGYNPCLRYNTQLLTDKGYVSIGDVVNLPVNIWNGEQWSAVVPFSTGVNELVRVNLTDGSSIECTPYHNFLTVQKFNNDKVYRVQAQELEVGDKLQKWDMPVVNKPGPLTPVTTAYSQGFYAGDGSRGYEYSFLYSTKYECIPRLFGRVSDKEYQGNRRQWTHGPMQDKSWVPINHSLNYQLEWLAGLLDSDGTVTHDANGSGFQITSVDKDFLLNTRLMLSTMGVRAKVVAGRDAGAISMPDGKGGSKAYNCQESFRLLINNTDAYTLLDMGMYLSRLKHNEQAPQRDARQYVRVASIEWLGIEEETFCVTEPLLNQMTVNGTVVGNCAEQSLANYETCCLAELMLPNCSSIEELKDVATLLYRINKHSLALPCSNKETEKIVHKNMRMGIGVTGYLQATEEQRTWLPEVYEYLRAYDVEYSKANNWPVSIKIATVKPSGTLSLLPGVTPGAHPAYAPYMIRRVRVSSSHALVKVIKDHGYPVEYAKSADGTDDRTTVVAEFPFSYPEGTRMADDMTAIDQLEVVRRLQTDWSDNSVSCTIYYKKEELPEIRKYLEEHYNKNFKSLSFLLHSGHGFVQAPIESISKEEFEKRISKTRLIESVVEAEFDGDLECAGGVCPVK